MTVSIQIRGINSATQFINSASKKSHDAANKAIIKSGFFIEGEVKQSIAGHRAEHMSVDTGRLKSSVKGTLKSKYEKY